ncbi:hypothetical protein NGA_0025802 [Nannochloropsis gaditana CCMP526]|nr:hypothetical protein NGA_0025802 [Nannochloropsis gaditana CCMP526]EKU23164.1 hypothetical protein NGA_0025802 [Nannochloropsis gaditana CCMP526]|eukprot:XP_005852668.1 hypothetical protein NGA_0025802 [Nannochloropsis gaditana CCMP526]
MPMVMWVMMQRKTRSLWHLQARMRAVSETGYRT